LSTEGIQLSTRVKILGNIFDVLDFKGTFYDTTLSANGRITLDEKGGLPKITLSTKGELELTNLNKISPALAEKLEPLHLRGIVDFNAEFNGKPDKWQLSLLKLSAQSRIVSLLGYNFKNVTAVVNHGEQNLSRLNLTASLAEGELVADLLLDPRENDLPIQLTANLTDANLAQMGRDAQWQAKEITGLLRAQLALNGPLLKTDLIKGQGNFKISDGKLWKFNFLKGLWRVLLIPELENIVFTDASASFTVHDNKLFTQDLIFKSQPLDLAGKGWLDINRNTNLVITPHFRETEILGSQSVLRKGPSAILSQADGYLNIRITGNLSKLDYKLETLPGKVLGSTTGSLLEGVQGILENILQ